MAQGRKPLPTTAVEPVDVNHEALTDANQALNELGARSLDIAERYGDGLPYDRARVVTEARFFMATSAEAMLEAGKRLIQIKENEAHGEFVEVVTGQLGLSARSAQRMMAASVKYLSPQLGAKAPALALLGRAKLFDLMDESNEELESLADGGTLAGLQLDEIETMTSRELKQALRDHKQQLEAKNRIIEKKNKKIDALDERLHKPFNASPTSEAQSQEEQEMLDGIKAAALEAQAGLLKLSAIYRDLDATGASESMTKAAHLQVEYLAQRLAEVITDAGIPVQFEEMVQPSWLKAATAKQTKAT